VWVERDFSPEIADVTGGMPGSGLRVALLADVPFLPAPGRVHPSGFFRVDRWSLTAQGKLDRAWLVWMADFGDSRQL